MRRQHLWKQSGLEGVEVTPENKDLIELTVNTNLLAKFYQRLIRMVKKK